MQESKLKYKAVIFDFNGTLFWDTLFHNSAWDIFLAKHNILLAENEKKIRIHGRTNHDILPDLFQKKLNDSEINAFIHEKETIYQQMVVKFNMELAPGAVDFFNFLKSKKIPFTIATASGKENVDFFFEYLKLKQWFDYEKVVFNDNSFPAKPAPDIYLKASEILKTSPENCVVFEDSEIGIQAAESAGIGKIIKVNSTYEQYAAYKYQTISNFNEVDRNIF
jgi:HAD superfamily hydrolase (TIGR01509 family)